MIIQRYVNLVFSAVCSTENGGLKGFLNELQDPDAYVVSNRTSSRNSVYSKCSRQNNLQPTIRHHAGFGPPGNSTSPSRRMPPV